MSFFLRLIVIFGLTLLMGCAHHLYSKPCQRQCMVQFKACSQQCENNCRQCSQASRCQSSKMYARFVKGQTIQGGIIARQLNSYRDPLQCRKTTCDCETDYRVCSQACHGIIKKRLRVPPACC